MTKNVQVASGVGIPVAATDVGSLTAAAVTLTIASPCVVTDTGHAYADGQQIVLTTTGALPTGLTAGAVVFVKSPVAGVSYNLAASAGGAAINTTGSQSGVHTRTAIEYEQRVFASTESKLFSAAFSTLTRPANVTPYSANDSISDNATAGSVTALVAATASNASNDPLCITELILDTNDTGLAAGVQVRAYLFNSDPTASSGVVAGDNVAYSNKKAGFIGSMTGTFRAFSDGGKARLVPEEGAYIVAAPSSGGTSLWVQYQALGGFTPSANSTTIAGSARGFQGRA